MESERSNRYAKIAIAILVAVLIILCVFLVRQYQTISHYKAITAERMHFAALTREHSLGIKETELIESWMTFDYVSASFKVPVPYLRNALKIASSTLDYPNITLAHYARTVATSSEAVVEDVRAAVRGFLLPVPAKG